jgi:hypothetical protein
MTGSSKIWLRRRFQPLPVHPRAPEDPPLRPLGSGARNRAMALQIAPSFADSQLRPPVNFFDFMSSERSLASWILPWPSSWVPRPLSPLLRLLPFPIAPPALASFLPRRWSPSVALRWTSSAKSVRSRFRVKVFVAHAFSRSPSRSGTSNPCSTCALCHGRFEPRWTFFSWI